MRRQRKAINQINVVPYIDVMLVLLVIFMVTAPLITPGQIELPSVGGPLAAPVSPLTINVSDGQTLTLKDGPASPVRLSRDALVARVLERQRANPNQAVVIEAAGAARYQSVIEILDVLQRSGVHKVGLLARPQP